MPLTHTVTTSRYCADRGVKFSHPCHVGGVSTHRKLRSILMFVRNNESARLTTEINDGTFEQYSFSLSFFLFLSPFLSSFFLFFLPSFFLSVFFFLSLFLYFFIYVFIVKILQTRLWNETLRLCLPNILFSGNLAIHMEHICIYIFFFEKMVVVADVVGKCPAFCES